MKEKKYTRLQIACGEILDVKLDGNNFVINTNDNFMFNILIEENNKNIVKEALAWQGFNGDLIINRILKLEELQAKDIEKLKKLGIQFVIEGD